LGRRQTWSRAIAVLEEALRRKPGQLEPLLNLALASARGHETKKARDLANRLLAFQLPANNPLRQHAEKLIKALGEG
jgi:hypothetical protein